MSDIDKVIKFVTAILLGWAIGSAIAFFIIARWGNKLMKMIMGRK